MGAKDPNLSVGTLSSVWNGLGTKERTKAMPGVYLPGLWHTNVCQLWIGKWHLPSVSLWSLNRVDRAARMFRE